MNSKLTSVILAGGSGSRLWPLSRTLYPKQFLKLNSNRSMLQDTILRNKEIGINGTLVVCNEEHRFITAEQLNEIDSLSPIILEPTSKNTAPAIALAALQLLENDENSLMLVSPADHLMHGTDELRQAIEAGISLAESGKLVTFGITPSSAETGYGYIKKSTPIINGYNIESFIEKPNVLKAREFYESGEYYWNSGTFLFKARDYLSELEKHCPEILECCKAAFETKSCDLDFIRLNEKSLDTCSSISIDYAVMEVTSNSVVVPLNCAWSDIGSWSSLWDINDKDSNGNAINGDVLVHDCSNSMFYSSDRLVTGLGLDNIVVVETKDAIFVADKSKVQNVKELVAELDLSSRTEHILHREVYRPWGKYDSIDSGTRDHVKRITVNPGEKLSIQMHHHRSEHWIVVSGTAKVTNGDEIKLITEDQSIYIPLGNIHALENPGMIPLEMIEVQTGSYLGEDDIVRFEDRYGRLK